MFNNNQSERSTNARSGQVSVLAADLVITGVVASEGTIEVHGTVDGEIAASILTIGQDGRMNGKVQAGQLDVRGELNGQVACGSITLRAIARMKADCQSTRLVIESGAEVEGRFSRPGAKQAPALPVMPTTPTEPAGPLDPVSTDLKTGATFEPKAD